MSQVRCAIYTRKSSDEGLKQDFNSLDAQREACAAYVLSQASEGWKALAEHYDDGGLSGGTLERPALQRLLADIKLGRVDIIVVYKVDRLTRSLLDFAKLVEALDAAEVSFVSVTQSFNTTTSMGRLTLNMLLSFAQFEREVTAERIRDKIAASKAKGMWMGGIPHLGYEPDGRSLAIVEEHATIIRDIFRRYRELGNVRLLAEALAGEGVTSPVRSTASGKSFGGRPFSRGQLYAILKNPIYAGDIAHKDQTYPGNQDAIIARDKWDAVQQQLADNTQGIRKARQATRALLAGLLTDEHGNTLQAVHTTKGSKRYRYYIRLPDAEQASTLPPLRLPADEIEQLVRKELRKLLGNPLLLCERAGLAIARHQLVGLEETSSELARLLKRGGAQLPRQIVKQICVHPHKVTIALDTAGLARVLAISVGNGSDSTFDHIVRTHLKRSGLAMRLVQDNGEAAVHSTPDPALVKMLLQARAWWTTLCEEETDVAKLARARDLTGSYVTRVVRLAFLAPDVIDALLRGRLRADVDGRALLDAATLADWNEQRARLLPGEQV